VLRYLYALYARGVLGVVLGMIDRIV